MQGRVTVKDDMQGRVAVKDDMQGRVRQVFWEKEQIKAVVR